MKIIAIFLLMILLIILSISLFITIHPVFGGKVEKFESSKNFRNGKFQNQIPTSLQTGDGGMLGTIINFI